MLPKKILVLRFSAMGDVVLLEPVLRSLLAAYPEVEITVVTRPKFASFFSEIKGVSVFAADVDKEFKRFFGLYTLFKKLHQQKFELVVDEHDHLRTMLLRTFFFLSGVPVKTFNKGRTEKKKFTRKENKVIRALPHTVDRYQQAFLDIGFAFTMLNGPHLNPSLSAANFVNQWLSENKLSKNETWIGLAPFAMHRSKVWPIENYKTLLQLLLTKHDYRFFLFGGGASEIDFFNSLAKDFPNNTTLVAGVLKLDKELALMQHLDMMLCVDSSNMHLATLVGTPVLSIWGGTHPQVGFGPFQRDEKSIIQIGREELPCRPCSVYGKETCHRGDFACLTKITPEVIAQRVAISLNRTS